MNDQECEYEYFVEMHRGYTPARKDGLWRASGKGHVGVPLPSRLGMAPGRGE